MGVERGEKKATSKLAKHGASFEEAASVLGSSISESVPDPDHSWEEQRWITVGVSAKASYLMVAHTMRGENIRIISGSWLSRS